LMHDGRVTRRPTRRAIHGEPVFLWREGDRIRAARQPGPERPRNGDATEFTHDDGSYPVMQRYGYAFVWYGNPANASPDLLPSIPVLPADGLSRRFQTTQLWDCSFELQSENILDLTHGDFLHSTLFGTAIADDDEVHVESTSETVTMTRIAKGRDVPKIQRYMGAGDAPKQDMRQVMLVHIRTGLSIGYIQYDPGISLKTCFPANPESPSRTRSPAQVDPGVPSWARNVFVSGLHIIGRQDNWAMREQNDAYLRQLRDRDLSSRFDKAGLRFRKKYQALCKRQQEGDYSYLPDGDPGRDIRAELYLD